MLNTLKVLYIEDDKNTRDALSYYLKKRTGKLIIAGMGTDALEQYNIHNPEIIIVDLLLPDMNGLEVIKEIRKRDAISRIIITSSVEDTEVILKTVDMGIDGYIIKPINPVELTEKLNASAELYYLHSSKKNKGSIIGEPEEKRIREAIIKKQILNLIKKKAGRGARDVTVSWIGDTIEIILYDSYTVIEKTLLEDIHNFSSIEHLRGLFYKSIMEDFEGIIMTATEIKVKNENLIIDVRKKTDKLKFTTIEQINSIR